MRGGEEKDVPLKKNDHHMDAIRYAIMDLEEREEVDWSAEAALSEELLRI